MEMSYSATSRFFYQMVAKVLTVVIKHVSCFTCVWIFCQPQMAEEMKDFCKYADE